MNAEPGDCWGHTSLRGDRFVTPVEAGKILSKFCGRLRMYDPETGETTSPKDILEWAAYFESGKQFLAQETLDTGVEVSTVFIGHMVWDEDSPPFETMVAHPDGRTEFAKYKTAAEARQGHQRFVEIYSVH